MSTTVDERVVEMRFDNRHFEENVQTTLSTLDKLKQSLNLSGATKGLEEVSNAAKGLDLSVISSAADTVRLKFSALQVMAITALTNITNSAVNAGKRIVSALTIDPIKSGFQEYETQINAVQTILANTSSKGKTIKDVNAALDELNAYADKTIYNFTEMTRNIGTFTAAGVDLDTSVQAIKGIANLAAVSGSTSQQASTAMYQLSQALSSGTVKLQDWNSVVNAGMGGQVFQDALKETARVHGVAIDQMIEKNGSFRETLKDGWLTSEILTETLSKFTGDLSEEQLKTMGYTDEQIKSIVKMGQTANDAATKVKTFTQLFDTLKEAAQSGWTQSWEIIVGDFEEAKELLTEISDIFGEIINESSAARNEMLQGWKDLGGRTVLIEALRNAFEGIMSVITPVKEAFEEIFPPITSEQLYALTEGLKNLTASLKLSDEQSAKLKSTFKGLFAILDIIKQAFVAVWNVVKPLFGGVGKLGDGILSVTASWGDWLVQLNNTIKKTDIFNKVLQNLVGYLKTGVAKIKAFLVPVVEAVKGFVSSVKEKFETKGFEIFHSLLSRVNARMEETGEAIGNMKSGVTTALQAMGETLANCKFVKIIFAIWEGVKIVARGIANAIGGIMDDITNGLSNANFDSIFDLVSSLSVGGVAAMIMKFINSLSEVGKTGTSFIEGLTDIKDAIVDTFGAVQSQLKAGTLMKIATAIAVLAASVLVISLIDSEKLAASLQAIAVLFVELIGAMNIFGKIDSIDKSTRKACTSLVVMSVAIAILAGAMKSISGLDWDDMLKGLIGIAGLAAVMVGSAKILSSGNGQLVKGASSLVLFAAAVKILASACEDLGALSWEAMVKGLIGVGILLGEVSLFLNTAKFGDKATSTAIGMVILAAAVKILASACGDLGEMSAEELGKGLASIAAILAALVLFSAGASGAKNMVAIGAGMILIAASMKIFASAVGDLGAMSTEAIVKGLLSMAGVLAMITAVMHLIPADIISKALGLVVVGAAITILADALGKMGGMSLEGIAKGLLAMGIALAELAIALYAMTGTIAGSAALLVAATALAILAPTMALLGAMSWEGIAKGLITIAGAFVIIGAAGLILSPIIGVIVGLAGAFALIGVAVIAAGAGLALAGVGVSALAAGITALAVAVAGGATAIVAGLTAIIGGTLKLIPLVLEAIGEGIIVLCEVLADGAASICKAVTKILKALISALKDCIPPLIELVGLIITELLVFIVEQVPAIVSAALQLIVGLLDGIAEHIDDVIEAGVNVVMSFVRGVVMAIPQIVDAGYKMIIDFCNGMANAIRNNNRALIDAVDNLMDAVVTAIGEWFTHFSENGKEIMNKIISGITGKAGDAIASIKQTISDMIQAVKSKFEEWRAAGKDAITGFIEGVKAKAEETKRAVKEFFDGIVRKVKDFLGIHSPSTVFAELGANTIQGFINGMGSLISRAGAKVKEIVDSVVTAVSNFASKFKMAGQNLINNVVSGFSAKLSAVKTKAGEIISAARTTIGNWASKFKSTATSLISNVVSGFGIKLSAVKEKASSLASSAKEAISNWWSSFKSVGRNLVSGLIQGIGEKASSLVKKAEGVIDDAIQAAKNLLGIKSPSRVFAEMGRFVDEGFVVGLESFAGKVATATEGVGNTALDAMSAAISGASDIISGGMSTDPVIRPVLDLSQIKEGSGLISGMFGRQTVALAGVNAGIVGGNTSTLAALASQMDKLSQHGNDDVVSAIATLRGDVADLATAITKMRVVLDSGATVGELLPQIDSGLGRMASHKGRGN